MVDVAASIIKLAVELSKIPETVKINRGQCQLLVDRIDALAGHLQRMQREDMRGQLEKSHEVRCRGAFFFIVSQRYHHFSSRVVRGCCHNIQHSRSHLVYVASLVYMRSATVMILQKIRAQELPTQTPVFHRPARCVSILDVSGDAGAGALSCSRVRGVHAFLRRWHVDCEGAEERQASRDVQRVARKPDVHIPGELPPHERPGTFFLVSACYL